MSYPINYPTPQGANVQIFKSNAPILDWVKPQGASFVWVTLIGGGAGGDGSTTGGGSGAVTNFMGPAFLIPDVLVMQIAKGGAPGNSGGTSVLYYRTKSAFYQLLTASGGAPDGTGAVAASGTPFSAMGFFQAVAGQRGSSVGVSPSATTFLSGGGGGNITANYGYGDGGSITNGFFQMQPIIVGVGSDGSYSAGVGCGGGLSGGRGGDGMIVIITW